MANAELEDATDFFAAIDADTLPAVTYVKPDGLLDGHPASSKLDLFEGMLENILDHLKAKPELMAETALIVTDHVSILKFIERNWRLKPLTHRSRDNFPNPIVDEDAPYVPVNSPALGDLFDMFHFDQDRDRDDGER